MWQSIWMQSLNGAVVKQHSTLIGNGWVTIQSFFLATKLCSTYENRCFITYCNKFKKNFYIEFVSILYAVCPG